MPQKKIFNTKWSKFNGLFIVLHLACERECVCVFFFYQNLLLQGVSYSFLNCYLQKFAYTPPVLVTWLYDLGIFRDRTRQSRPTRIILYAKHPKKWTLNPRANPNWNQLQCNFNAPWLQFYFLASHISNNLMRIESEVILRSLGWILLNWLNRFSGELYAPWLSNDC